MNNIFQMHTKNFEYFGREEGIKQVKTSVKKSFNQSSTFLVHFVTDESLSSVDKPTWIIVIDVQTFGKTLEPLRLYNTNKYLT